jgi:hypothetical protein
VACSTFLYCWEGEKAERAGARAEGGKAFTRARLFEPHAPHPPPNARKNNSRQFNHRCKGVTMATFKPEEVAAIEDGGNAVCFLSCFFLMLACTASAAQR